MSDWQVLVPLMLDTNLPTADNIALYATGKLLNLTSIQLMKFPETKIRNL